jgi:hypothetical protein
MAVFFSSRMHTITHVWRRTHSLPTCHNSSLSPLQRWRRVPAAAPHHAPNMAPRWHGSSLSPLQQRWQALAAGGSADEVGDFLFLLLLISLVMTLIHMAVFLSSHAHTITHAWHRTHLPPNVPQLLPSSPTLAVVGSGSDSSPRAECASPMCLFCLYSPTEAAGSSGGQWRWWGRWLHPPPPPRPRSAS